MPLLRGRISDELVVSCRSGYASDVYRDDGEAARSRIRSLEAEVQTTRRRIADRERSIGEGCTARDHLAAIHRVAELEAKLAKAKPGSNAALDVPQWQFALKRQVDDLRAELEDLRLLGRGDDAIQTEITMCRTAIQAAESELATLRSKRALAVSRRTMTLERGHVRVRRLWRLIITAAGLGLVALGVVAEAVGLVPVGVYSAICTLPWWRCRVLVRRDGLRWTRHLGNLNNVLGGEHPWHELREVRFLPNGDLHVRCKSTWFRFQPSQPDFSVIAQAVLDAAARLQLPVGGSPPALLAAGPASPDPEP